MKTGIISAGIGNVASVKNMLSQIGISSELLSAPPGDGIYDWIILPGVGAFDNGITKLRNSGWFSYLQDNQNSTNKSSLIGICLGMQLLCDGSEEGNLDGLGFIPGYFRRFQFDNNELKVPHMCWDDVIFDENKTDWGRQINQYNSRYYFVHSYYYTNNLSDYIIGTTKYGVQFGSAIQNGSIIGLQFHPEKSHKHGKLLLSKILK